MAEDPARLVDNAILGRKVRAGGWRALAEGTVPLLRRLIEAGDEAGIADQAGMFLTEMRVIHDIYTQWFKDTKRCLVDKGATPEAVEARHRVICETLAPYHKAALRDRGDIWREIEASMEKLADPARRKPVRLAALEAARDQWRDLHDCEVDQLAGLFDQVMRAHGERALREMYQGWVVGDWFDKRYRRFDVTHMAWSEASWLLTYLGFEGHHGHLSGTARDGTIDYVEDEEKVTISFAPCGSGGRSMEGEARDGLPALMEAPFHWPALQEAHDFTWNEKGICSYCAHCCMLHEVLPIARFGYPVRITEPPKYPLKAESRCSWTVYKDLRAIPEEAYRRVGARKPPASAPLGSAHMEERARLMDGKGK